LTAAIKIQSSVEADFFIFLKANKHKLGFNKGAYYGIRGIKLELFTVALQFTLPKSRMLELPVTVKGKMSIKHFVGCKRLLMF